MPLFEEKLQLNRALWNELLHYSKGRDYLRIAEKGRGWGVWEVSRVWEVWGVWEVWAEWEVWQRLGVSLHPTPYTLHPRY